MMDEWLESLYRDGTSANQCIISVEYYRLIVKDVRRAGKRLWQISQKERAQIKRRRRAEKHLRGVYRDHLQ